MPELPVRPGRHRAGGPVVREPWDVLDAAWVRSDGRAQGAEGFGPEPAGDDGVEGPGPEPAGDEGADGTDPEDGEERGAGRGSLRATPSPTGRGVRWWSELFDRLPAGGQRVAVDLGRHWWLPVAVALVALVLTVAIAVRARPVATAALPSRQAPAAVARTPGPSIRAGARAAPSLSLVGAPATTAEAGSAGPGPVPTPATASATVPTVVVVDVAGRVRHPGVVRLPGGSRVGDAVAAAGGALPGTDLTPLNLAQPLLDGEQVRVGVPGSPVVTATPGPGRGAGVDPGAAATTAPGVPAPATPVDLNTADEPGLDQLPGIGPVLAARILTWRTAHGPFASVDALEDVPGIGPATLERLRDLITTGP